MSSSSRFMTDFPPHRLLIFTFLGCPCSVDMDWATAMSLKVPSEGCVHKSIYLAMMKGASSPIIPLHALCIDAPQICGISGMRIGRCLSEFRHIHFLARRCVRFESFVGNDCSSKTTSQPRKHLLTLRIIFGHCHDTEQKVAVNK